MNVTQIAGREWDLSVEEFRSCLRIDPRLRSRMQQNIEVEMRHRAEDMSDEMLMRLRIPAMVLQDAKVVARYPDGLWQHIRKACRLSYRCVVVRLREVVTFPDVSLPDPYARNMRVYTEEQRQVEVA